MEYYKYYTTEDVIDKHHFTQDFLTKCLQRLKPIFKNHMTLGEYHTNNARLFLFSSEAMNIFSIIAQKKQNGQSIAEIGASLLQAR